CLLFFRDFLDAELDATTRIQVSNLDHHFLAFGQIVAHVLYALRRDLRDVNQTVLARQDGDKGAEVDDAGNLALVETTHFRFRSDALDAFDGCVTRGGVFTVDADVAIVIDVDGSTGLFGDAADDRAALADHIADLVRIDLHGGHGRCILGHAFTWLVEHLVHLGQDVKTGFVGLVQGNFHDLFGDALDLDVHLQRGNAIGSTGYLEVHVAQVIFVTEDVGDDGQAVAFLDQAHRDTGNRRAKGDTCVHQCQRAATYGCHGAGAVGLSDLGYHANRVGECLFRRHDCLHTAFGQLAVDDLSALV